MNIDPKNIRKDRMLTLKEAVPLARRSEKTLRNAIKAKILAAELFNGTHGPEYRIRFDALMHWRAWGAKAPFIDMDHLGNDGNPGTLKDTRPKQPGKQDKIGNSVTLENATMEAVFDHLKDENAFLRFQLKEKDKQLTTAQTHLSAAMHQIEALTAMAGSFAALGTSLDHREQGKGTTHDLDPSTTTPTATAKEDPKPKEEQGLLGRLIKFFTEPPTKPST